MKFPNWFKIGWWVLLLGLLTAFLWSRLPYLQTGEAVPADIVVFLVWIGLALAPIFPEIELFGLRLKQEIKEIKRDMANLIVNQNQNVVVNVASQQDIERKHRQKELAAIDSGEIKFDSDPPQVRITTRKSERLKTDSSVFESKAFHAIRAGDSPMEFERLNEWISVSDNQGKFVIDAVASSPTTHYLIEIKYLTRPSAVLNAIWKFLRITTAYHTYISQQPMQVDIVPVLILPVGLNVPYDRIYPIPYLLFDAQSGEFVNAKEFAGLVDNWLAALAD